MNIYVIADTHFGHANMREYCGRPEGFERKLFRALSRLTTDDLLIHLGDVCIGHDAVQHEKWVRPLACRKWLVKGNHDRKSMVWYLNHGWDFASDFPIAVQVESKAVVLSHAPVDLSGRVRYLNLCAQSSDVVPYCNVHGHFHNTNHRKYEPQYNGILTDRHRLVACEVDGYGPLSLNKIVKDLNV